MGTTYNLITSTTVGSGGASSVVFNNISQNYTDLIIRISARSTAGTAAFLMTATNNDVTPWFASVRAEGYGAASPSVLGGGTTTGFSGYIPGTNYTSNYFSTIELYCGRYSDNLFGKNWAIKNGSDNNATNEWYVSSVMQRYYKSSPITSVTFTCSTGNFAENSTFYIYGVISSDATAVPSAPTIGTATAAGKTVATVAFTPVTGAASYTATSSPGGITATSANSPIVVSGLTDATSYTFTVKANNAYGSSASSSVSNSITTGSNNPILIGRQYYPFMAISGDAQNWGGINTVVPKAVGRRIMKVGSTYIAVTEGDNNYNSGKVVMTSTDGVNWTERLLSSSVSYSGMNMGASDGTIALVSGAVGGYNSAPVTFSSTDGITWTQRTTGMTYNTYTLGYKNGYFIVTDGNGNYCFSTNGTSFTQATAQWSPGGVPNLLDYYGGAWWLGGNGGELRKSTTINPGSNWTSVTSNTTMQLRDIAVNGSNAIIGANDSRIIFSSNNGSTWTEYTGIGTGYYNNTVMWVSSVGLYFVLNSGYNPNGPLSKIYTSSNGTTWTERTSPNIYMGDAYGRFNG